MSSYVKDNILRLNCFTSRKAAKFRYKDMLDAGSCGLSSSEPEHSITTNVTGPRYDQASEEEITD